MAISWRRRVANYVCCLFDFFSRESPDLPHEIIEEIFIRIPVKSLLRFRCVSKSCRGMIDSRDFINKHLKHSSETTNRRHFFVSSSGGRKFMMYEVSLDISHNNSMTNSWIVNQNVFGIVGSCNGLLLLIVSGYHLVLWNPFTRKYQNIPECYSDFSLGFGYDNINDDYKIVNVTNHSPPTPSNDNTLARFAARIYSLRSSSWKTVPSFIHSRCIHLGRGAYASGYVHWLASDEGSKVRELLAFNFATDEFTVLSLPKDGAVGKNHLSVIGGCLCVVSTCNTQHSDQPIRISLSLLNSNYVDRGVETWKKLWSVEICNIPYQYRVMMPIVDSNACIKLLLKDSNQRTPYMLYDLQDKKCTTLGGKHEDIANPAICFESLVALDKDDSDPQFNIVMRR